MNEPDEIPDPKKYRCHRCSCGKVIDGQLTLCEFFVTLMMHATGGECPNVSPERAKKIIEHIRRENLGEFDSHDSRDRGKSI